MAEMEGDTTIIRYCGRIEFRSCWSFVDPKSVIVVYRYRICAILGPPTPWLAAAVILAEYARYKVVPFGEMEANSSDPKHVG